MSAPPSRVEHVAYLLTWQVARLFNVSPKTVSRWAAAGKLPYVKTLGGHRRFEEAEVRALLAEMTSADGQGGDAES